MIPFRRKQAAVMQVARIEAALVEAALESVARAHAPNADLLLVEWQFPRAPAVSDPAEPMRLPLGGAA